MPITLFENEDEYPLCIWKIEEPLHVLETQFENCKLQDITLIKKKNADVKKGSLAARLCVHHLINKPILFKKDQYGALTIHENNVCIGLSHTHGYAAAIISENKTCAIDIEKNDGRALRIASKFLGIHDCIQPNNPEEVTLAWSIKESVYKWWKKKNLIFKEDIQIKSLTYKTAQVTLNKEINLDVYYKITPEFIITWIIQEQQSHTS